MLKRSVIRILFPLLLFFLPGCEKRTVLLTESNDDGSMRVEIAELGDPGFPYGPAHCNARLYRNNTLVREEILNIKNDGKHASEENFSLFWQNDGAQILVTAEEEEVKTIYLPYELIFIKLSWIPVRNPAEYVLYFAHTRKKEAGENESSESERKAS